MTNETSPAINVTEQFPVDIEALYKAWVEPDQLKKWWKPMDKQLASVENDVREGGKVVYRFEAGLTIGGQYKEVKPAEKLVYSWNWELPDGAVHNGEYLLTVLFKGE